MNRNAIRQQIITYTLIISDLEKSLIANYKKYKKVKDQRLKNKTRGIFRNIVSLRKKIKNLQEEII